MPKPLNIDWDHAKALYMKGMTLPDIAAQTGTSYTALRAHALRHEWKADATKAAAVMQQAVAVTFAERGQQWGDRVAALMEKRLDYLETLDPSKLKLNDLETLTRITEQTDKVARRTFGLDEPGHGAAVVGLKVNLRIEPPSPPEAPVIDVPASSSQHDVRSERG